MVKIIITWLSLLLISFTSNIESELPIMRLTKQQFDDFYASCPLPTKEDLVTMIQQRYPSWSTDYCVLILGTSFGEGYINDPYLIYAWCCAMLGYRVSSSASYDARFLTDQGAWDAIAPWGGTITPDYFTRPVVYQHFNSMDYDQSLKACYLAIINTDTNIFACSGDYYGGSAYSVYHSPIYTDIYVWYVVGRPIEDGYSPYVDNGYPTKLSEFRITLFHTLAIPTMYWSEYPHNLGYWCKAGESSSGGYEATENCFSFDCNNLVKAILNGWYDNRTFAPNAFPSTSPYHWYNYFQPITRPNFGDWSPLELIQNCANVSYNFGQLNQTSVLFYDGPQYDHIGVYVGEFIREGHTYNTIECTTAYGGGVVSTYVDSTGRKYANKETPYASGSWLSHGLLTPWLVYDFDLVDPGGIVTPIPPGGGVNPPWVESPQPYSNFTTKPWMYQKRYDLQPKNRWRYI